MRARGVLTAMFSLMLATMLAVTLWASSRVALWNAGASLKDPWTIATLFDAYFAFLTFTAWVFYKENSFTARALWLLAILCLGSMAMAAYVLRELSRLGKGDGMERLLLRRGA